MREDKTRKFCIIKEDIMFRFRKPALTADAATHGLAGNHANRLGYSHLVDPTRSPRGRKLMNVKILPVAVLLLPMASRGDSLSAGTGTGSGPGWRSFRRIVDIPFETCVAALEGWRDEGSNSELQLGHSSLRGPVDHDRGSGTCRVEVRLGRGPLRPPVRMRLNLDCWSRPSSTALELIPRGRVRATASYFRAGHLLLDSLARSLQLEQEIRALDLPGGKPCGRAPNSNPGLTPSASRPAMLTGYQAQDRLDRPDTLDQRGLRLRR